MAKNITELATIRITVPLEGPDVFDDARIFQLPVGSQGTVVYVHHNGAAYEVEFLIWLTPDHYRSVMIPVEAEQCELVWEAPD